MNENAAYVGYAYAYPHKTAYRPLDPPLLLREVWAAENKDALFLYLHVPFCEMRCGFCNLFTLSIHKHEEADAYIDALRRQARRVKESLAAVTFARMAIGGGTPTHLGARRLSDLFDIAQDLGASACRIPCSIEASPGTTDVDVLKLLRARGVARISIGIETFNEKELAALRRPERASPYGALERIRESDVPVLNIDLIYGIPGQTVGSWLDSLREALRFNPEELYLYPLYVRPLTGLARKGPSTVDRRLELYREGRAFLHASGYRQESMRMFRRSPSPALKTPDYCCQDDGMVGLGCGARSYTTSLHYSSRYAVTQLGVREIVSDYLNRRDNDFDIADFGVILGAEEQRRRWVIKSLLRSEGLSLAAYSARFGTNVFEDLPELKDLESRQLARTLEGHFVLTPQGLELSDAIGVWLYSVPIVERMETCELR